MKDKFILFLVSIFMICNFTSAWAGNTSQTIPDNQFPAKCGLTLSLPAQLLESGQGKLGACVGSYEAVGGAVLSLAPIDSGIHDPNWIDRIPMLHIRHMSIGESIKENKESIFQASSKELKAVEVDAPTECKLEAKTKVTKIYGKNWKGWLAEDFYINHDKGASTPEYCERHSKINRCVRMIIGNAKFSATMAQYCLTRNSEDFDLSAGLSYGIFLKTLKTILFLDE